MNVVALLSPLLLALPPAAAADAMVLTLTAERLLHEGRGSRTTAEGRARLSGRDLALNADRIVYDRTQAAVTATGHVVARVTQGGLVAVTADVVTARLDGDAVRETHLLDGRAVAKADTTPAALRAPDSGQRCRQSVPGPMTRSG